MPRRAAAVTQADIARAIRALRDAGAPVERVRVRLVAGGVIVETAENYPGTMTQESGAEPSGERKVVVL